MQAPASARPDVQLRWHHADVVEVEAKHAPEWIIIRITQISSLLARAPALLTTLILLDLTIGALFGLGIAHAEVELLAIVFVHAVAYQAWILFR